MRGTKGFKSNSFVLNWQMMPISLLCAAQFCMVRAEGQNQFQGEGAAPQGTYQNSSQPGSAQSEAFRLSASQNNSLPPQQPSPSGIVPPRTSNSYYPNQPKFTSPLQNQYISALPQMGYSNRPQFVNPVQTAPSRIFSAEAVTHSGPGFLSEAGPLAYDLTICQDDANFHPPYLLPNPEILNPGAGFGESSQNVRSWQIWADRVAFDAWKAWRQHALPVFGYAEIDITLNRDGSFRAKRGIFGYHSDRPDMPVEQAPFLTQLDPFLNYLENARIFRIPDSTRLIGSSTIDFQLQLGVRQKDQAHPYSWCGFMKDWSWWTGTGLPVYQRVEYDLNGLGKH